MGDERLRHRALRRRRLRPALSALRPTGLTAALELAAAGVSCRIIDKQAARSDKSRALVVQARTLELLERHGLGRELVARGATSVHALGYVAGRKRFEV